MLTLHCDIHGNHSLSDGRRRMYLSPAIAALLFNDNSAALDSWQRCEPGDDELIEAELPDLDALDGLESEVERMIGLAEQLAERVVGS